MFRNFLLHGIRVFRRQKSYFFLNVIGLSIGIATSLFIFLYIFNELSYDNFHSNKDRIYRLILEGKIGEQEVLTTASSSPVGPYMHAEFPEVAEFCRMNPWGETVLKYNNNNFTEDRFIEVDSSFFSIFSIPLLTGDKKTVLNRPHTMVLSRSTATKIFGNNDVIGRTIKVGTDTTLYTVTGVMEDFPQNSHFEANVLASFMTNRRANDNNWLSNSFTTYLLLKSGANPQAVNDKLPDMIRRNVGSLIEEYFGVSLEEFIASGNRYNMHLQEMGDIHLNPAIDHQQKPSIDPKYLYIFGSIAILIIIIASINFMNLSTAQAARRAKEVGIKKVSGSTRQGLVRQFLFESILLTFISMIIALLIVWFSLPYINQAIGTELQLDLVAQWYLIPLFIAFAILVGVFAGSYPAFYLSSFSPAKVLKSGISSSKINTRLRSTLVVVQFSISIVLIIGTLIMFRQINYMLKKDLGFNKERVLVISRAGALGNKFESFKNEIKSIPAVINVSSSTAVPGRNNNTNGYVIEGRSEESFLLETNWVDHDYFDTYGLSITEGRFFSKDFKTDREAVVINHSAVKRFGLDPVLNSRFVNRDNGEEIYMPVIGVVKDFHFKSLHSAIDPYIFRFKGENIHWGYISVKLSSNFTSQTIDQIERKWENFTSNDPLQYFFLDQDFNQKYREERQNATLSVLFSILAIFIASLGLFGLTSFTIEARTKEIGIRKAMGASVFSIFYLISRDIGLLVIIATLIAWPVIYYVGEQWLSNYHYRIEPGVISFVLGFFSALFIALITISYRALKSARMNPAHSLRYE